MREGPRNLIGEFKRRSPFEDEPLTDEDLSVVLPRLEAAGATMISILVDPDWGGSYDDLREARELTTLPLLAKGLAVDPDVAAAAGATCVLSFDFPREGIETIVEVHTPEELQVALDRRAPAVMANNRDLLTGEVDYRVAQELSQQVPDDRLFIAASGYANTEEAPARADAVLIGTALLREPVHG